MLPLDSNSMIAIVWLHGRKASRREQPLPPPIMAILNVSMKDKLNFTFFSGGGGSLDLGSPGSICFFCSHMAAQGTIILKVRRISFWVETAVMGKRDFCFPLMPFSEEGTVRAGSYSLNSGETYASNTSHATPKLCN